MSNATYLTSLHEFHNQEEILVVLVDIEELYNVWVINLFQNVDFVLKPDLIFLGQFTSKNAQMLQSSHNRS